MILSLAIAVYTMNLSLALTFGTMFIQVKLGLTLIELTFTGRSQSEINSPIKQSTGLGAFITKIKQNANGQHINPYDNGAVENLK